MSPSSKLGDWLTVVGLFAIGLIVNVIFALLALVILEWLGSWPAPGSSMSSDLGDPRPQTLATWLWVRRRER